MYRHSLDDLIMYTSSIDIKFIIPKLINDKKYVITAWEVQGRYDLHFVVRTDILKRYYEEL